MASNSEILDEALQLYKTVGLETVAKEVGIITGDTELMIGSQDAQPRQAVQMIAVPIPSPMRSPYLPKLVQGSPSASSPMSFIGAQVIGAPQRVIHASQVVTHKGTHLLTPVQSPHQEWAVSSRKRILLEQDYADSGMAKRKKGEKGGKGLRHFSMKVCEKVQRKGVTSYNEVADELVTEFTDPRNMAFTDQTGQTAYDQKNIRRRVYDALNVLMAMNIISKEKKEIKWIGLPTNSAQECQNLDREKKNLHDRLRYKTQQLQELILQQIAFKNLVSRNRAREQQNGPPAANSAIQLPFIIVNTSKKTVIDCSISNDKYEYLFNFDNTFEIHDDIEVLKRMGMAYGLENGKCSAEDLRKAIKLVPKSLESHVLDLAKMSGQRIITQATSKRSAVSAGVTESGGAVPGSEASLDAEVALVNAVGLSRQSSLGSYSESVRDTPDDDYSEEEDDNSRTSSPPALN